MTSTESLSSNYLLACPFCGGTPRMATEYDPDGVKWHYITCRQCGARIRGQWHSPGNDCPLLRAEVRDQWNRRASVEPSAGVKCTHCNGKGYNEPIYDEQDGWIDETPCETCNGSGRITTVEQYLKTLPANWHEDSSLETWFPITAEELKRLKDERASQPPSAWQPIETAPHDREVLFWVVPLSADETYRDTSGNPITSGEKPRMMFCRFGRWSSLSKAIYWADVPGSPTVTKSAVCEHDLQKPSHTVWVSDSGKVARKARDAAGRTNPPMSKDTLLLACADEIERLQRENTRLHNDNIDLLEHVPRAVLDEFREDYTERRPAVETNGGRS